MKISRIKCENCGKEQDTITSYFEIRKSYRVYVPQPERDAPMPGSQDITVAVFDFCSRSCMMEWLPKQKDWLTDVA